jgi:hypothetical protein
MTAARPAARCRGHLRYCIDWSEQRPHLAGAVGAVGAALTGRLFDLGWLRRAERGRAVHITGQGRTGFAEGSGTDGQCSGR